MRTVILTVNCIVDPREREAFNRRVSPWLAEVAGGTARTVSLDELTDVGPGEDVSHVVISGSELSAARRHDTDEALLDLVRRLVDAGRPVLGICYGHQMIARALVDDAACRRAAVPEFGFKTLTLAANPLFDGIETLVPVHSHYDEVCALPEDRFEIIASTDDCAVQAFQVRECPVWGVQFHPELFENFFRARRR